jgi:cytochrome c oxidase assembly factor CtaG
VAAVLTVEPLQLAPVAITAALYARRCLTLRPTPRAVSGLRQASFYFGLALITLSLIFLGGPADELFWAHMAEHLMLADLGSLFIVLGLTGPVLAPVLRLGLLGPLKTLANPLVALPLWAANLYLWHITAVHEAAVDHAFVHALQHFAFIATGINVWMCLFGPLPMPQWFGTAAKAGYIIAMRLISSVLANVFLFGGSPFYDVYRSGEMAHGISAATDQKVAGAVMMVEQSILTICLFCWLFLRAARESEERQQLLDQALAEGVELDPERARRAVESGHGDRLSEKIARHDPPDG